MLNRLFTMCLMAVMAIAVFSCHDKDGEEISVEVGIVGTWTLESNYITVNDQAIDEFAAEVAKQWGDSMQLSPDYYGPTVGLVIDFKTDHTLVGSDSGFEFTGTWSVAEANSLYLKFGDGLEEEYIVQSLNSSTAVLYYTSTREEADLGMGDLTLEKTISLKK